MSYGPPTSSAADLNQIHVVWVLCGGVDGVNILGPDFRIVAPTVSTVVRALSCATRSTVHSGETQTVEVLCQTVECKATGHSIVVPGIST